MAFITLHKTGTFFEASRDFEILPEEQELVLNTDFIREFTHSSVDFGSRSVVRLERQSNQYLVSETVAQIKVLMQDKGL